MDAFADVGPTEIAGLKGKLGPRAQVRVEKLARLGVVRRESEWPRPVVSPKYEIQFFLKVGPEEAVVQARLKKNAINQRALLDAMFEMPEGVSASELRERSISPSAIKILKERGVVGTRKVRVIRDPPGVEAIRTDGSTLTYGRPAAGLDSDQGSIGKVSGG